jgi:bacillithiol biosynthesis cysteine-adding enzyme BshC
MVDCSTRFLPYEKTKLFSSLVLDYLRDAPEIRSLYSYRPDKEGFGKAMADRKKFPTERNLVYKVFSDAYLEGASDAQKSNIESLLSPDTFTICTAHQPNIFTGYLYFIYKIIHAVKLAEELKEIYPQSHFVPVYFMGSEDNDLEELGQVKLGGAKLEWKTKQTGAVGRMKVDGDLLRVLGEIEGQLGVQPFGKELMTVLRDSYREGVSIAESTFRLVNHLFASYGLLVFQADNASLKNIMRPVFEEDLFLHKPHELVSKTGELLHERYKVQVNPREINLFYLVDDIRERITGNAVNFSVDPINLKFTKEQLVEELHQNPERFSPNVVLRGLYQETILPDIAFIGGGSEIAYWLELKALFDHYQVPFPVLVLRNSFLLATREQEKKLLPLGLKPEDLFSTENEIMNVYVKTNSQHNIDISGEVKSAEMMFESLRQKAAVVDVTLVQHIEALRARWMKQLEGVSKKMLRAEKRKFETEKNQLQKIRGTLFPNNSLQERVENFMPWYARKGKAFIDDIYRQSPSLQHEFGIIICD